MEQSAARFAIPHYHSNLGIAPIFSGDRLWLGFEYLFCARTVKGPRRIPSKAPGARNQSDEIFYTNWNTENNGASDPAKHKFDA